MKIIDAHCHLDFEDYSNLDEVIKENKKAGVAAVITNGTRLASNLKVLKIAAKYDIVKAAMGLHPTYADKVENDEYEKILALIKKSKDKIIAIGEIGLDNKYPEMDKKKQLEYFTGFVQMAEKLGKPVIVHSRMAELETVEVLESSKLKNIVMHYFAGRQHLVKRVLDNGWMLSIPTNMIRLQQLQDNVMLADISQILTETDGPFLSPYKDISRNEPRFIIESLKKIAEIKKMKIDDVSEKIYKNYKRVYEK